MFSIKPRLSGENSIIVALGVAALIIGLYNAKLGPLADAHATGANDGNLNAALKKAGWESVVMIAGLALLTQDANIVILGGATVIAEELGYRHAIMASPDNGQIQVTAASYVPAQSQAGAPGAGTSSPGIIEAVAG